MDKSAQFSFARGTALTSENRVRLLVDSDEFLPAMVSSIDSAQHFISFQFLNMEADAGGLPIAEALIRASKRGVVVKGILDKWCMAFETNGQWSIWPSKNRKKPEVIDERKRTIQMFHDMRRSGIELAICRPGLNNGFTRNHRKSIIVDNRILIVGGFNPTDHNRTWHEICVWVEGKAAVESQKLFNEVFTETGFSGLPLAQNGSGIISLKEAVDAEVGLAVNEPKSKQSFRTFFVSAVESAQKSFRIENAYFSDPVSADALAAASRRGVQVQLIVPARSNHPSVDKKGESQFSKLLSAGVEIYKLNKMTHAKVFSIDDDWVSVGSANLTPLNLRMERELNVVARDSNGILGKDLLHRVFLPDIQNSERVL